MKETIRFKGLTLNGDEQSAQHGELSLCGNVELHDGALRPSVLKGTELAGGQDLPGTLMYVHVTTKYTNFITRIYSRVAATSGLWWYREKTVSGVNSWVSGKIIGLPESDGDPCSITSVGNTLCLLFEDGLEYALCKGKTPTGSETAGQDGEQEYDYLGSKPPFAEIQFNLHDMTDMSTEGNLKDYEISLGNMGVGLVFDNEHDKLISTNPSEIEDGLPVAEHHRSSVTEQVLGIVNKRISEASEKKLFYAPFVVRYCYRLFDGSMVMHSAPVLMTPSLERSVMVSIRGVEFTEDNQLCIFNFQDDFMVRVFMLLGKLQARWVNYDVNAELLKWKDIVKSVDIFITPQFSRIDSSGLIEDIRNGHKVVWADQYEHVSAVHSLMDGIDGNTTSSSYTRGRFGALFNVATAMNSDDTRTYKNYFSFMLPEYSEDEHLSKIKNASSFYRIASIKTEDLLKDLHNQQNDHIDINLDVATLYDVTTQEQMTDDYKTHNLLLPESAESGNLYTYNHRLHVYGINERLFEGFSSNVLFAYANNDPDHNQDTPIVIKEIDVIIKDGSETKKVILGDHTIDNYTMGYVFDWQLKYFFYPDSRAVYALIWDSATATDPLYYLTLADHPFLNGATYEKTVTGSQDYERYKGAGFSNISSLRGKIYTSKADNPFYFPNLPGESGINTVGTGDIIGIAAVTRALSQGQVGDHDLVVFATDGIWVMKVSSTGTYTAMHNISRTVCVNQDSICQLDQSIAFATKRSLSLFRESDVQSLSDVLDGPVPVFTGQGAMLPGLTDDIDENAEVTALLEMNTPAVGFFSTGKVLYDFASSRLIVFPLDSVNKAKRVALVYSLRDRTWSTMYTDYVMAVVPGYPWPYIHVFYQEERMVEGVRTVIDRQPVRRIDLPYDYDANVTRQGIVITRTLTYSDTMDVIRGFRQYCECAQMPRLVFYGSDDQLSWQKIGLSERAFHNYMPGHPFRFFRIAIHLTMKMSERYQQLALEIINKYAKL